MSTLIDQSLDVYVAIALVIGISWLYITFKEPSNVQKSERGVKTSLFLLAHTLYILYYILVARPENLFQAFKLPINTHPDVIKAQLLQLSDTGNITEHLDMLLKRLGSFDMRILYVRFGHDALANCEHCATYEDFALFSLPRPILSYIREIAVIGILTLRSSNRAYLRPLGVGTLVIACLTEFYWMITSPIQISKQEYDNPTYMLHDQLLRYRNILFLLLPLVVYKLPDIPIPIPILSNLLSPPAVLTPEQKQQHLATTLRTLEHLLPSLHLLKYTKASIMRTPGLRQRAENWWEEEEREGKWMLEDENMRKTARAAGLGYSEGTSGTGDDDEPLLKSAKHAAASIQSAAVPSEHWL